MNAMKITSSLLSSSSSSLLLIQNKRSLSSLPTLTVSLIKQKVTILPLPLSSSLLSSSLIYRNISTTSSLIKKYKYINPTLSLLCNNNNYNNIQTKYQPIRNMGCKRFLKTKQSAAKRFIVTGKGKLKFSHQGIFVFYIYHKYNIYLSLDTYHNKYNIFISNNNISGKAHLNGHKSRKQIRRLNKKGRVTGTMEKNMKMLILNGK